MHSLIIFDLDDTLAESKSQVQPDMAQTLSDLLSIRKVAIITGGKYEQIIKLVWSPSDHSMVNRLRIVEHKYLGQHSDNSVLQPSR